MYARSHPHTWALRCPLTFGDRPWVRSLTALCRRGALRERGRERKIRGVARDGPGPPRPSSSRRIADVDQAKFLGKAVTTEIKLRALSHRRNVCFPLLTLVVGRGRNILCARVLTSFMNKTIVDRCGLAHRSAYTRRIREAPVRTPPCGISSTCYKHSWRAGAGRRSHPPFRAESASGSCIAPVDSNRHPLITRPYEYLFAFFGRA